MKDKQIEDFSRDICKACVPFTQCELDEPCRMATREAEIYYDLGYRKDSEVAGKIIGEILFYMDTHKEFDGADFGRFLAELEMKYTEDGK